MTEAPQAAPETETDEADEAPVAEAKGIKPWFEKHVMQNVYKGIRMALKPTLRVGLKVLFDAKFSGMENFNKVAGKNTLIIANHVSFIDGFVLGAALPTDTAFAIDSGMYKKISEPWYIKYTPLSLLVKSMNLYPMDMNNALAIRPLTRLAKAGKPVMIFPEGRLTTSGTMMQTFGGPGMVAVNAEANILPIYMDGLNFLPKIFKRLKDYPGKLFPKISLTVLEPKTIIVDEKLPSKVRRAKADEQMEKIMQDMPVLSIDKDRSLIEALHRAASNFGYRREMIDDADMDNPKALTYGKLLTGVYALGGKLAKMTSKGENVGFLLPNSKAAPVAFFGLHAYGRVPTMMNAKAEKADMLSYVKTASLKTIVTSRKFVELAKLEEKIAELSKTTKIVYLEDVKQTVGLGSKIKGLMQAHGWLPRPKDAPKGTDPAAIIFTSGSEGAPKGVVLSSSNFLANVAQVHAVTPIKPTDKIFNAMPIFHSFGLAGGMIMPLMTGIRSFQFPNPLANKQIPKLVYFYDTTIMFGTDTFLGHYAKNATDRDFSGLRMVFAGAERLQDETYDTYINRFNVRVNNAYGLSEAAPAVAMNVPGAHRRGTVGKILPGIETKLEEVPGMDNAFRMYIKGPNVMLGYLKNDKPGVIQPPPDGWHDTGDIVTITDEGYIKLAGRAKRFAKIGGEMVNLDTVEKVAAAASQKKDAAHATILVQDPADGDKIVLFTTDPLLKRDALTKAAGEMGQSILGLPKNNEIFVLTELPKLSTGKTDYVGLGKKLAEIKAAPAAVKPAAAAAPAATPAATEFNVTAEKPAAPLANDNQQPKAPEAEKPAPKSVNGGPAL